ncbi:CDC48 family AAA ATPase [Candidatus Woesearchaeota archaeon]|jgi:transitional endoplasmic reticulum ATPase|nr:CDC48 family AAA ATPase [Candidatus Woesearchaeota archaeon]MBT4387075.1 CDC48 family AAA ATPase [Candidatus Woesearchaeota archaeon]MBT4596168.1 CDC48 family AAA ATPase [Candidatus Woesearchaeota archaeon]MBT5741609.1 CDC48 family AAA ATPase [Candidatus Woesearchaeota archaeon]MBT6505430.1 CDC48 family AAA ATPase [Candidatus Woesearchaeota archaeon]
MSKEIQLDVIASIEDDVNKGIVRIDYNLMKQIDIEVGDIVEIEGTRKTVAIVDRAYPGDIGRPVIRIDGIVRRNARTSLGESVKVRKADVKSAEKVVIAPARKNIIIDAPANLFKQGLLGRPIYKGDVVSIGGSKRRRKTLSGSPHYNEIYRLIDDMQNKFLFHSDMKYFIISTKPNNKPVIITNDTIIEFQSQGVDEVEDSSHIHDISYEDIGGLEDEVKKIREMVEVPLKHPELFDHLGIEAPKAVLLHGPPGTGKTLLARAVAAETNASFYLINGPEIMSKFYGESEKNLRGIFEEAEKNAPSIIFIDEIDAIATKREESKGEVERRVVAQLLTLMDGLNKRGKVIVVAASNLVNSLDPALRRPGRFDREIHIGAPNANSRLHILKIHTRNMPLTNPDILKTIADQTYGFTGADLSSLVKESAMIVLRRLLPEIKLNEDEPISESVLKKLVVSEDDLKDALKVVRPSALREIFIEVPKVSWENIGGLNDVKNDLKEAVEWPLKHPKSFSRIGINPPRGILLYGSPGTGKTLLAKAVANESKANFILVKGSDVISKWVGESEKTIKKLFNKARETSPSILFFDEIDAIAPKRTNTTDSKVTERIVNTLLTEMDGLEELHDVVIIAATNRPDIIDNGLLRPGRFDRIILVGTPDYEARLNILKVHTKNMKLSEDVDLEFIATETEYYVGADLQSLCRESGISALRKNMDSESVTMDDFNDALKRVGPSSNDEIEKAYEEIKDKFKFSNAREIKNNIKSYFG